MPKNRRDLAAIYIIPSLKKVLEGIFRYPLTIVEAGSGFSKTTAAAVFFSKKKDIRTLWYTCFGEGKNNAWNGICGLIGKADAKKGRKLARLGAPGKNDMGAVAAAMEELTCSERTVLVLDNYQLTGFGDPIMLLDALSAHRCSALNIVVLYQDIQWSLRGTLHHADILHIGTDSFVFSPEDIERYFYKVGYPLDEAHVKAVYASTEGWIAAVRLKAGYFAQTACK